MCACRIVCTFLFTQNLDGPLRGHAEDLFEEMKRKYQESLQQDNSSVQTKSVTEYSGEEEAEDKHKEWDRMCDKEDRIFGDEDVEDLQIPIEETGPEMDGNSLLSNNSAINCHTATFGSE